MNTKLTLTINKEIIVKAKKYAKQTERSLSNLIESYLDKITRQEQEPDAVPDEFKELFGVVNLPVDPDDKQLIRSIALDKNES
jgi:uncharacterized protein (UPF0335 family)